MNERANEPCKKCLEPVSMLMRASSPFYTCATVGCVFHIPIAALPQGAREMTANKTDERYSREIIAALKKLGAE